MWHGFGFSVGFVIRFWVGYSLGFWVGLMFGLRVELDLVFGIGHVLGFLIRL